MIPKVSDKETRSSIQIELDGDSITLPKCKTSVKATDHTLSHGTGSIDNVEDILNQSMNVVS